MGETVVLSLLLLTKKALDSVLEKGVAISAALVKRQDKFQYKFKITDWDSRCESCLMEGDDEKNEGERS